MTSNKGDSSSPRQLIVSLWNNASLIRRMTRREVVGRYKGSVIGIAWSFFNPLLMLLVYTFVFSKIFQSRWPTVSGNSTGDFAIMVFIGMIIHTFCSECLNKSPETMLNNKNYITKVVFPLEILPVVNVGVAIFHLLISLTVAAVGLTWIGHVPGATALVFPILILPLVLGTVGVTWITSSLGVYIRDIGQLVVLTSSVLLFLSPVFYPTSALPEKYQSLIYYNPLTYFIEGSRGLLLYDTLPELSHLALAYGISLVVFFAGYYWFQKTRKGFADVL
ncbi:ABC transporter permease [Pseudomonas syringae]|uniref:ABC transporter permease n=1 Tax=Pseudomonas viridiflava TaxID=33069 RepID=UPI000F0393EC|nr:ABC transporter permease [Pseudomonas viridiflava]